MSVYSYTPFLDTEEQVMHISYVTCIIVQDYVRRIEEVAKVDQDIVILQSPLHNSARIVHLRISL